MGESVERGMTTGRHVVRDLTCLNCNVSLSYSHLMIRLGDNIDTTWMVL